MHCNDKMSQCQSNDNDTNNIKSGIMSKFTTMAVGTQCSILYKAGLGEIDHFGLPYVPFVSCLYVCISVPLKKMRVRLWQCKID